MNSSSGLLPKPFIGLESNKSLVQNSFLNTCNVSSDTSTILPWYNSSNSLQSTIKIEDPTIQKPETSSKMHKWANNSRQFPPKPLQKRPNFPRNQDFYCDTCDRSFMDEISYQKHQGEHITCNIQGCKFRAHPKIVGLHKKMQHLTGLAKKIMSLDTPEDIKKWREERKKNFPTVENVEKRKQELEEKKARGEILDNKYFGKMRGRGRGRGIGGGNRFNREESINGRNSEDPNKSNFNFRGRFRGQGGGFVRGRGVFRGNHQRKRTFGQRNSDDSCFEEARTEPKKTRLSSTRNISQNYDQLMKSVLEETKKMGMGPTRLSKNLSDEELDAKLSEEKSDGELDTSSDDESNNSNSNVGLETVKLLNASHKELELCQEKSEESQIHPDKKSEAKGDQIPTNIEPIKEISLKKMDEEPLEKEAAKDIKVKLESVKGALGSLMDNYGSDSDTESDSEPMEVSSKIIIPIPKPKIEPKKVPAPNLYPMRKRQTSLLEKLLSNEIRHERNIILQCVHHIVKNNFFDNKT